MTKLNFYFSYFLFFLVLGYGSVMYANEFETKEKQINKMN